METHGRKKVAELLEGIEMIPPKFIEYRGGSFPELDVEAVIRRQPQVVLVDELAHTNTPGSKNPKRWQDIEELLEAGITVISTVNPYGKGVQSNSPAMPKFCPICGHNSIQRATKRGVLNLYRCVGGHYFIFHFDPSQGSEG